MRLLITGGAGFIGASLSRRALKEGHQVVVLDDFSTGHRDNLKDLDVCVVEGSLLQPEALECAVAGVDSVVHLAALGSVPRSITDPVRTHEVNVNGTLRLLEAIRAHGVPHVAFASSSSVYGKNPALPKQEREWVRPMSPYAVSKLAGEQYVLAYQDAFGIRSIAFRLFNVYGPGQRPGHAYAAVIPVFLEALRKGQALPVNGSGMQSRDFTYVDAVCRVFLSAIENQTSHDEPVNLAFGTNTTLLRLVDEMQSVTGLEAAIDFRPARAGDVSHSQADNSSLSKLFPDVDPVDISLGLAEAWEWLKRRSASEIMEKSH